MHILKTQLVSMYHQPYFLTPLSCFHAHLLALSHINMKIFCTNSVYDSNSWSTSCGKQGLWWGKNVLITGKLIFFSFFFLYIYIYCGNAHLVIFITHILISVVSTQEDLLTTKLNLYPWTVNVIFEMRSRSSKPIWWPSGGWRLSPCNLWEMLIWTAAKKTPILYAEAVITVNLVHRWTAGLTLWQQSWSLDITQTG